MGYQNQLVYDSPGSASLTVISDSLRPRFQFSEKLHSVNATTAQNIYDDY